MTAARQFKTAAEPERALVFVEHIRLKCQVCGIIIQPTELERALWFENRICPKCSDDEQRSACDCEFDDALYEADSELQKRINQLESQLKIAKVDHAKLIKEADCLTVKHSWLSKRRITEIKYWRDVDVMLQEW